MSQALTDVIGRGVIQVAADSTELKAGIEDAKRSVKDLGGQLGASVAQGSAKASRVVFAQELQRTDRCV